MSLFKKEELERIQNLTEWTQFLTIIEVPTDTGEEQLAPFDRKLTYYNYPILIPDFVVSRISTDCSRTVRCDKIKIHSTFCYDQKARMGFEDLLNFLPESADSRPSRTQVSRRLLFISGLALSSILKDAKLKFYDSNQSVANRLCHISGATVRAYLEETLTFTGDAKADFAQAFLHLWHHFPSEVTANDSSIKRMALLWPSEID